MRFRTLGCWPLIGAIESKASDIAGIVEELLRSRSSERQGRLIDVALQASMERKKRGAISDARHSGTGAPVRSHAGRPAGAALPNLRLGRRWKVDPDRAPDQRHQGLFEDQIAGLKADSRRFGTTDDHIDFALLLDGLEVEREQGITIDAAHRFFATSKRAFVVLDAPAISNIRGTR